MDNKVAFIRIKSREELIKLGWEDHHGQLEKKTYYHILTLMQHRLNKIHLVKFRPLGKVGFLLERHYNPIFLDCGMSGGWWPMESIEILPNSKLLDILYAD